MVAASFMVSTVSRVGNYPYMHGEFQLTPVKSEVDHPAVINIT
jgi:hypothetical protein